MYKIALINMPFATVSMPSIALTQLKSVVEKRFPGQVEAQIHYWNHDFAQYLGLGLYRDVSDSLEANMCGLGDWFFRDVAFPGMPDNTEEYFTRYFPQRDERFEIGKRALLTKRKSLDSFLSRLIARYRLADCDLVGLTSMFSQNLGCFALARKLKEKKPGIVTVLGGANCEAPMGAQIAAHVDAIDFVFSGPGLASFPELVGYLLSGEEEPRHKIQGVFSRQNVATREKTGFSAIGPELDIDTEVDLDYEPFLQNFARNFADADVEPVLLFETSRGCWWGERSHCTFCGLNGGTMKYRAMDAERAVSEMTRIFDEYGDRCSRYQSVDNILPRNYLKDVFPKLTPPPHISMFYEVKADLKRHEMEILAKARVVELQPGIESLNTGTLKLMRKGTTSFQNLAFLKYCVLYGVKPHWNLLIGFPGEEKDVYEKYVEDIPSLYHLPPPSGAFPVRFDRFSPYFTQQQSYGLDLHPSDFYRFLYPFEEEVMAEMIYYFVDHNYASRYLSTMSVYRDKIQAEVERWHERWGARDGLLSPTLRLDPENPQVVLDTRYGNEVRHDLGKTGSAALAYLSLPKRVGDLGEYLAREVGDESVDAGGLLADLKERRLVFEEREMFLSVLLPDGGEGVS